MAKRPKVSVVVITYNHEKYIRQTLDSFVAQQATFAFEVVVADDCSPDNTPRIIAEYAQAYPDIFRPILRKKNIGAQNNSIDALRAARGEYVALCEGDDYWTDPAKLQTQADYLDKHQEYALCFHPVQVVYEDDEHRTSVFPDPSEKSTFTLKGLLKRNFIQTNSVMYRRKNYDALPNTVLPLDWYLHLFHAQTGKIGFIPKVMAAYRRHAGGIWWESDKNIDIIWKKYGVLHVGLYAAVLGLYGDQKRYRDIVQTSLFSLLDTLIDVDRKYEEHIFADVIHAMPDVAESYALYKRDTLAVAIAEIASQADSIKTLKDEKQSLTWHYEAVVAQKEQQLTAIKSSKFWRLRTTLARLLGRT